LIGAGPGDPELLTIKAAGVIASCDSIVYDYLVNPEILAHARQGVELIYAGKRAGRHALSQQQINSTLIELATEGKRVGRLKGGDPFVFGRGGEEAEALVEAGIEWEVVPGISAGVAAAAYAGIPLTHRSYSSGVAFVTGHESVNKVRGVQWSVAARGADTLVIFMCAATLATVAQELISGGRAPLTPIAIISWGTYEHQEVFVGNLCEIASLNENEAEFIGSPAIAVIGEVTKLASKLQWFGQPPKRIPSGEHTPIYQEENKAYVSVRCGE